MEHNAGSSSFFSYFRLPFSGTKEESARHEQSSKQNLRLHRGTPRNLHAWLPPEQNRDTLRDFQNLISEMSLKKHQAYQKKPYVKKWASFPQYPWGTVYYENVKYNQNLPNAAVTPAPKREASKPKRWLKGSLGRSSIDTDEKHFWYNPADRHESCHYMEFRKNKRHFSLIILERIAMLWGLSWTTQVWVTTAFYLACKSCSAAFLVHSRCTITSHNVA